MGGYWDPAAGRYVTATEVEGLGDPFTRNRAARKALAYDLVKFGEGERGFAEAAGTEVGMPRGAARQFVEMVQAGAYPQALSARLADDRVALGVDPAHEPGINADLVGQLAEEADENLSEIWQNREAGEIQEAFETWADEHFGFTALQEHVAGLEDEEQQGFLDALVGRFEDETAAAPPHWRPRTSSPNSGPTASATTPTTTDGLPTSSSASESRRCPLTE